MITTRKSCSKALSPRIPLQPQARTARELLPAQPPRGPSPPPATVGASWGLRGGSVGRRGRASPDGPPPRRSPEANRFLTFNLALTSELKPDLSAEGAG